MDKIDTIDQFKQQMKLEIADIFWVETPGWLKKRYRVIKEKALSEVFHDIFENDDKNYLSSLQKANGIIHIKLDMKYKYLDFMGFITPLSRFILPFVISFITLLFTIKSIRDLSISYLFGITWPTFLSYFVCILLIGILLSIKSTKAKEKRKYALYIGKRLEQELIKNLLNNKEQ